MPDDTKIKDLPSALQIADNAKFPYTQANGGSNTTYSAELSQIGAKIVEALTYVNLLTTAKTIEGAINELAQGGGASADITSEIDIPAPVMTFSDGGNNIPLKSLVTEIVPIQASGTPSPSNPLPISGHNSITVNNVGKYHRIIPTSLTPQTSNGITVTPKSDGTFYVSGTATANSTVNFAFDSYVIYSDDGRKVAFNNSFSDNAINISFRNGTTNVDGWSVSPTNKVSGYAGMAGKTIDNFNFFVPSGKTVNGSFRIEFYIESTMQTPVTVSLPETIYGGNASLTDGAGIKEFGNVDLSTLTWVYSSSGSGTFRSTDISSLLKPVSTSEVCNFTCEMFLAKSGNDVLDGVDGIACNSSGNLWVHYGNMTSVSDFLSAISGCKLVYPLLNNTTISFSPVNIPTLSGTNNIYTDCGDIQSLEYFNENGDDIASLVELESGRQIDLVATLVAGQTSLTFTNSQIKADSTIDVYTDTFGVNPTNVTVTAGQVVLTFSAQQSNLGVKVRLS